MSFTELFTQLVIRHKVMTITEFYNADAFDLDLVASNIREVDRDACERMRNIMWAVLAPNSKKKLSPNDIITFSWENTGESGGDITTEDQFNDMCKRLNLKQL